MRVVYMKTLINVNTTLIDLEKEEYINLTHSAKEFSNSIKLEIRITKKEEKESWDTVTKKQNTLPVEKSQSIQALPEQTPRTTKKSEENSKEDAKQKRKKQK